MNGITAVLAFFGCDTWKTGCTHVKASNARLYATGPTLMNCIRIMKTRVKLFISPFS